MAEAVKASARSRRGGAVLALACLLAAALFAFAAPNALAAHVYQYAGAFSPNCPGGGYGQDLANDSAGNLYVVCGGSGGNTVVKKFDRNGNPVNFTAHVPYVSENAITGSPDPRGAGNGPRGPNGEWFGGGAKVAVDASGGPTDGLIYVASPEGTGAVEIFAPSGQWMGVLVAPDFGVPNAAAVGVDDKGNIYVGYGTTGNLLKYNPAQHIVAAGYSMGAGAPTCCGDPTGVSYIRPDSTGAVWVDISEFPPAMFAKYEADQLVPAGDSPSTSGPAAQPSPFAPYPVFGTTTVAGVAVDFAHSDELYIFLSQGGTNPVRPYSPGTAGEPAHQNGPAFGGGHLPEGNASFAGVAVDPATDDVYVGGSPIRKFAPGPIVPDVTTKAPQLTDIGHTEVTVRGHVALAGGPDVTGCELKYGPTASYSGPGSGTAPCSPDPASSPPSSNFSSDTDVSAQLTGLQVGAAYHYQFFASNANGQNMGGDRSVATVAVRDLQTGAATGIDQHDATLNGSLNPDSYLTTHFFEYGLSTNYTESTPAESLTGSGDTPVSAALADLQPGRVYHYRLVAQNSLGTTFGADQTFKTPSPPEIGGLRATDLSETEATLNAQINPEGSETHYYFEYGTTPEYGAAVPAPPGAAIAAAATPQAASIHLTGLQPDVTYHFRVTAANQWGTSVSDDTTFNFFPPSCPNEHVRQQTHSAYLPDCRAYELVSPANAGAVILFPSDITEAAFFFPELQYAQWPQNTGLATNPARFMFYAGLGSLSGLEAPNSTLMDAYMATRTDHGWVTTLPGLKGSETLFAGWHLCTDTLSLCLDHVAPSGFTASGYDAEGVSAPFMFDAAGRKLGQLPTDLGAVAPGAEHFHGDQRLSGDGAHFAFSSRDFVFAPGGTTAAPGSAYDDNLPTKTVSTISKLANGEDIPQDVPDIASQCRVCGGTSVGEFIKFPAISTDGSHVLMQTLASEGPVHLYMRVDDAVTYEVSRGYGVRFVGMTSDGSRVYFTARQRITPEDTDKSVDLYMWSEQGDTVTLVSKGNGQGNSDECHAPWTSNCDVAPLETERGRVTVGSGTQSEPVASAAPLDSRLASGSGDVYFYSPENLDPSRPGIPNERNLYVFREGQVQLVATLDPGTQVNRIQISPDGRHAAFLTASQLTGYDNQGFREMYTYNPLTRVIRCASCDPSGQPPTADVVASQGGPFMSNDGRAFFATADPLVPQDTDGVTDVYEYVDGRPQLISSGTASRDDAYRLFGRETIKTGLEGVSANGGDIYFTTYDTLAPQDQNGPFVKVYDARTNGGFTPVQNLAPCAAADECHGPGNEVPGAAQIGTGGSLGTGGNAPAAKGASSKRRHHPRRKRHHRQARHRHG